MGQFAVRFYRGENLSLFLLGAGFNVDAGRLRTPYRSECSYPLVTDVARLCFDIALSEIPSGKSIEDLFWDSQQRHENAPMKRLTEKLMEADYYLAWKLADAGQSNCYRDFFETFSGANFLTFNYDSLAEIFLFRTARWYPEDGYGVQVTAELMSEAALPANRKSASKVIHLHGSHCLRPSSFETYQKPGDRFPSLSLRARPVYNFDPDCLSPLFSPYRRVLPDASYKMTYDRVIAPVPNKATELEQPFVREVYEVAHSMVSARGELIAVGYSFNRHDSSSYSTILRALAASHDRRLVLVSPQAGAIKAQISAEFPNLRIEPIAKTFKGWAADSFHVPRRQRQMGYLSSPSTTI